MGVIVNIRGFAIGNIPIINIPAMPFLELTYKYSYQRLFLSIFAAIGKHFNIVNILLFIKKVYRPEPAEQILS